MTQIWPLVSLLPWDGAAGQKRIGGLAKPTIMAGL
jgi:hypothetical protein